MAQEDSKGLSVASKYFDDSGRVGKSHSEALIERIMETPSWVDDAECGLTATDFFSRQPKDQGQAKLTCQICPVRESCRKYGKEERPENLSAIFHIIGGQVAGEDD